MARLFFGIDLPVEIKQELFWGYRANIPGAKWVRENQQHVTLIFLDEIPSDQYEQIVEIGSSIDSESFSLSIRGLNFFGPEKSPKVIFAQVEANPALSSLQASLSKALKGAGFNIEKRRFVPHVTLARMKSPSTPHLGQYFEQNSLISFNPFEVREFCLFESQLSQAGATYIIREHFPFF